MGIVGAAEEIRDVKDTYTHNIHSNEISLRDTYTRIRQCTQRRGHETLDSNEVTIYVCLDINTSGME